MPWFAQAIFRKASTMKELDEILRLAITQIKAGRALQARSLAKVADELGDGRAKVVLSVVAGAMGEPWQSEPVDFDAACYALGLPIEESRACLAKAMTMAGVAAIGRKDTSRYRTQS